MPHPFPSEAWTEAYAEALNESEELRRACADWSEASIALVFVPAQGDAAAVLITLGAGGQVTARHAAAEAARAAATLVLEGSTSRWRELADTGIDPVKFFMQGKLSLTRGPLATLLREVAVARELLQAVQRVPTAR